MPQKLSTPPKKIDVQIPQQLQPQPQPPVAQMNISKPPRAVYNKNAEPQDIFTQLDWLIQPIEKQANGQSSPEREYIKILTMRNISPKFFKDSPPSLMDSGPTTMLFSQPDVTSLTHQRSLSSDSDSSSSSSSFKMNHDASLTVFNFLKNSHQPLSSPERRTYLQAVSQMNLTTKPLQNKNEKPYQDKVKPPETLRDIFKISNRNRKKNKQKKKVCRNDSEGNEKSSEVESVSQIIAQQYQADGMSMQGYNTCKRMDDLYFMWHLGWIDQDQQYEYLTGNNIMLKGNYR